MDGGKLYRADYALQCLCFLFSVYRQNFVPVSSAGFFSGQSLIYYQGVSPSRSPFSSRRKKDFTKLSLDSLLRMTSEIRHERNHFHSCEDHSSLDLISVVPIYIIYFIYICHIQFLHELNT